MRLIWISFFYPLATIAKKYNIVNWAWRKQEWCCVDNCNLILVWYKAKKKGDFLSWNSTLASKFVCFENQYYIKSWLLTRLEPCQPALIGNKRLPGLRVTTCKRFNFFHLVKDFWLSLLFIEVIFDTKIAFFWTLKSLTRTSRCNFLWQ